MLPLVLCNSRVTHRGRSTRGRKNKGLCSWPRLPHAFFMASHLAGLLLRTTRVHASSTMRKVLADLGRGYPGVPWIREPPSVPGRLDHVLAHNVDVDHHWLAFSAGQKSSPGLQRRGSVNHALALCLTHAPTHIHARTCMYNIEGRDSTMQLLLPSTIEMMCAYFMNRQL